MAHYLKAVDALIQSAFNHWLIGTVFWNIFLALALGYLISNVIMFRDQRRRAFEEVVFWHRRFYRLRGADRRPNTSDEWMVTISDFDFELAQIVREMEHFHFHSVSGLIVNNVVALRTDLEKAQRDEEQRFIDSKDVHGMEILDKWVNHAVTMRLSAYWRDEHPAFAAQLRRATPTLLELIDAPNFSWWVISNKARLAKITEYLDGKKEDWK